MFMDWETSEWEKLDEKAIETIQAKDEKAELQ